ncbi:O-antigen polymerase [Collinsella ihumii]|uniref:O-antigen polymerase n=1 Tax=Collinsella ihumii TaxID=1720204 RepID=UPI0025AE7B2B|nr:O-antigen polymerase [Collinsella ihumii]
MRQELASPISIFTISFLCAIGSSLCGKYIWDNIGDQSKTILVLATGIASFLIVSIIVGCIKPRVFGQNVRALVLTEDQAIIVPHYKLIILLCVITFMVYYADIKSIANELGFSGGILDTLSRYREYVIQSAQGREYSVEGSISFVAGLLFRVLEIVSAYALVELIFLKEKVRKRYYKKYCIILILIFITFYLCGGGRSPIVHLILCIICAAGLYLTKNRIKIDLSFTAKIVCAVIVTLIIFIVFTYFRGETLKLSPIGYITFFFGSGVSSLNAAFSHNDTYSITIFSSFIDLISKIYPNIIDKLDISSIQPWIRFDGYSSNVFTGFYGYYSHFGLLGVTIYAIISGALFSLLYERALKSERLDSIVIYCFYIYIIFDMIRTDSFGTLIGVPLIEYMLCLGIIKYYHRRRVIIEGNNVSG